MPRSLPSRDCIQQSCHPFVQQIDVQMRPEVKRILFNQTTAFWCLLVCLLHQRFSVSLLTLVSYTHTNTSQRFDESSDHLNYLLHCFAERLQCLLWIIWRMESSRWRLSWSGKKSKAWNGLFAKTQVASYPRKPNLTSDYHPGINSFDSNLDCMFDSFAFCVIKCTTS